MSKKFAFPFGIAPLNAIKPIVESACLGRQPDFLQRLLQVDDDLAAVASAIDAKAAQAAIKDEASFKAEWGKIGANCGGCHKAYRKPE